MASIWNANLTNSEIERYAYLYGKAHLACLASELDDQEVLEESRGDELEAEYSRGYADGELEATGKDMDAMLTALRAEVTKVKKEHADLKAYLAKVKDYLDSEACKKVAGRQKLSADITRHFIATPRY